MVKTLCKLLLLLLLLLAAPAGVALRYASREVSEGAYPTLFASLQGALHYPAKCFTQTDTRTDTQTFALLLYRFQDAALIAH